MEQRRGNRGGNGNRREGRAREAARHIAEMDARFAKEIAASLAGIREFDGLPKHAPVKPAEAETVEPEAADPSRHPERSAEGAESKDLPSDEATAAAPSETPDLPTVAVVDEDSVAAVIERGRGRAQFCDLAVLDFASFTSPGGGYDRGAWAQEEALCAESFLFNVLHQRKDWYGENRRRKINCNLYTNRGLVVPAVRFTRGKVHAYADVIVVAAPNARYAREDYGVKDDVLVNAMRDRIRFVLSIADELGHDKLILGAFGCGAFGWDADVVARLLREELAAGGHVAKQVVIAVPSTRYDENLPKFQHAFSAFPDAPAESYAAVASERAKAAEARAAQASEDEDDDDWRKYL